jgi:hypothetical protein
MVYACPSSNRIANANNKIIITHITYTAAVHKP